MWGVFSCFVAPFVCLLMIDSPQKATVTAAFLNLRRLADRRECAGRASPGHSPEGGRWENDLGRIWTFQENKRFESALAMFGDQIGLSSLGDFVEQIAPEFPGKSVEELGRHLEELWHDVHLIESGKIMLPEQWTMDEEGERGCKDSDGGPSLSKGESKGGRKRGIAWTKEEHERFLEGLKIHGKGDWKSISRQVVITKTPTQVASHAQKYFNRRDRTDKQKLRRSINDHSIDCVGATVSMSSSFPSIRYADGKRLLNFGCLGS